MLEHSICTYYIQNIPKYLMPSKFVCYLSRQWKGLVCLYAPLMFKTRNHIDILKQSIAYTCTFGETNVTRSSVVPNRPKLFLLKRSFILWLNELEKKQAMFKSKYQFHPTPPTISISYTLQTKQIKCQTCKLPFRTCTYIQTSYTSTTRLRQFSS